MTTRSDLHQVSAYDHASLKCFSHAFGPLFVCDRRIITRHEVREDEGFHVRLRGDLANVFR
jgi:hypothetical protein